MATGTVKTWLESTRSWQAYQSSDSNRAAEPIVVPAFVIQVENIGDGVISQTDLNQLVDLITDFAGPLPDDTFVHAFGDHTDLVMGGRTIRYLEPSKIAGDKDALVVFYKDALGTGWDCPRAEVMFSFRRAVDATSIGQTIGRMVRAPLARRIEEDDSLNACHVFLPHYNRAAVQSIVEYLQRSGNEAVASTIESASSSISVPLRASLDAVAAITKIPTYVVPVSPPRSAVRFLAKMARFLSSSGIDGPAKQREAVDGATLLAGQFSALAGDTDFQREIDENGDILIQIAETLTGESSLFFGPTRHLQATEDTITREFGRARSRLTAEVADAYVVGRTSHGASIRQAKLEARALSSRDAVVTQLEKWASDRIDALRHEHGERIEGLDPASRSRYFDGILQQAPDPTPRAMHLLPMAEFRRGASDLPLHLYGEEGTAAPIALGSSWEQETLEWELRDEAAVAWLRNVDRATWALRIPRWDGHQWRPFYPDFLIVRRKGERVLVDIVDPHDPTKLDSVSKAKGLAAYARRHAEKLGHVDVIAKFGATYRRLHLEREAIRKEVEALSDSGQKELVALFQRLG